MRGQAVAYLSRGWRCTGGWTISAGVAWSLRGRALVHLFREEYAASGRLYRESLQLCTASGDAWGRAWSLYALAFLQLAQGDRRRPAAAGGGAGRVAPAGDAVRGFAYAARAGQTRFEQGDVGGAEAWYREGLALSRETPLLTVITTGLEGLGLVAAARGRRCERRGCGAPPRRCAK